MRRIAAVFSGLCLLTGTVEAARPLPTAGARVPALGNAYVAADDDVNALFHNPAGLMNLGGPEISANYGRLDLGGLSAMTDGNAAFGMPAQALDRPIAAAGGFLVQSVAPGAHVLDIYGGAAADVPTRGLVPWPLRGGAALKIRHQDGVDVDPRIGKSAISLGLDAGALMTVSNDTAFGLVIKDLFPGDANPMGPQLRIGGRQTFRQLVMLMADVELRKKVTSLHVGAEWFLYRRLLRLRAGNGFRSGQVDHLALGAGFNYSPAQVDVAYLIPMKTFNDSSGQFRVSMVYRFNAPKFSELYFDRALDMAEELDRKIVQMQEKEAQLKTNIEDLEQARRLAEEDLSRLSVRRVEGERDINERLIRAQNQAVEAEGKVKNLEERARNAEEKIRRAERISAPRPAAGGDFGTRQRTHTVQPGDTLRALAERYYKDADRWKAIYNANKDKVDRGRPVPGTTLLIP